MKAIASLVGVFFILLGVAGIARPGDIMSIGYRLDTPMGLYLAATLRIVIGVVLLVAASASRNPMALRIMGGIIVLVGVATAFVGVDRARVALDWFAAQGRDFIRVPFFVMIAVGVFILSALTRQRPAVH